MKRSLRIGEWLRRGLGVAVLVGVATVALGLDTGLLAQLTPGSGNSIEEQLLERWHSPSSTSADQPNGLREVSYEPAILTAAVASPAPPTVLPAPLPLEGRLPELSGATTWLNSPPLSSDALRGKVVLIDFWTFACINCQRALPYVRAWAEKYKDQGLIVIGVHAPEFAFERKVDNVKRAAGELGLHFPIAIDNDFAIWRSFNNQYWPANYFIDAQGRIRFHHFGEGEYERSEQVIRQLLDEARNSAGGKIDGEVPKTTEAPAGRPKTDRRGTT
jgi:thiol-disulfide isomerase/thioredoxin